MNTNRNIPNTPLCYTIDENGNVYSSVGNRKVIRKTIKMRHKYKAVVLMIDGKQKTRLIHRLLALAFIHNDDPINKIEVCHNDSNKLNNDLSNLRWDTHSGNMKDAVLNHSYSKRNGDSSSNRKISSHQVRRIRLMRELGATTVKIAKIFKIRQAHISRICRKESWENIC